MQIGSASASAALQNGSRLGSSRSSAPSRARNATTSSVTMWLWRSTTHMRSVPDPEHAEAGRDPRGAVPRHLELARADRARADDPVAQLVVAVRLDLRAVVVAQDAPL